jgi:hypothetical protein
MFDLRRRKVVSSDVTRWLVQPGLDHTNSFNSALRQDLDRNGSKLLGTKSWSWLEGIGDTHLHQRHESIGALNGILHRRVSIILVSRLVGKEPGEELDLPLAGSSTGRLTRGV